MSEREMMPAEAPRELEDTLLASVGPDVTIDDANPDVLPLNRHALAGRQGALRVHELIRLGRLYEQEHDLKRGRQRLRQLIQQGRRYEQEHGTAPKRPKPRRHKARVWAEFVRALAEMVKPAYRPQLERLLAELDGGSAA